MAGLFVDVVAVFRIASRSLRKPAALAVLALAATLSLGAIGVLRANPGNPPPQESGKLTNQQLGEVLTSYYGNNKVNSNGMYSVNVNHGKYVINVGINLSLNGNVIWIISSMAAVPDPGKTSVTALLNILKKNSEIAPMFFMIQGNRMALAYPVANYELNGSLVKAYLEKLTSTVVDILPLWNNLGGR